MKEKAPSINKLIVHWIDGSDADHLVMMDLYKTKHYHWSLFIGHIVIEKLAKAVYVKYQEKHPPLIHDIRRILEKTEVTLTENQILACDTISRFNINARYDDYKQQFYNLCTKEFTLEWIEEINNLRKWIKNTLLS